MADVKISELPTGSASDTDVIPVVDGGATKQISLSALQAYIQSMGDNVKAKFGASDDLQIYHDGAGSYIEDVGTGNLNIRGHGFLNLQKYDGENFVTCASNGPVGIYYDNAQKLATTSTGVDVTGTVTADGLSVDGADTEASTSQILKVRNSTTGEAVTIGMYAKADNGGDGNTGSITFDAGADGSAANNELRFSADHQTDTNPALMIKGNGDISFYEDTGTTAKFFWDASAESLGIGVTNPTAYVTDANSLYVKGQIRVDGISNTAALPALTLADTNSGLFAPAANEIAISTGAAERLRIDSSGNVGIDATLKAWHSIWTPLQIGSAGSLSSRSADASDSTRTFLTDNAYNNGSSHLTTWRRINTDQASQYVQMDGKHVFRIAPSDTADTTITWTDAVSVDTSGNLLVGTTASGTTKGKFEALDGVAIRSVNAISEEFVEAASGTFTTITIAFQGGGSSLSGLIEINMAGYSGKYLDYLVGQYSTQSHTVIRDISDTSTSVAITGSAESGWAATITTNITHPVVRVKVASGRSGANYFDVAPSITFSA